MIFAASAPTVLGIYRFIAIRSTDFERHDTHPTYTYSLTIKRFALSTIVSYFGIALSAFIYMPFGQEVLGLLHLQLFAFDFMGTTSSLDRGGGRTVVGARSVRGFDKTERHEVANTDVCVPCDGSVGECVPGVGNALRHQVVAIAHQSSDQGEAVWRSIGHPGREVVGPCQGRSLNTAGLRRL
jgi:hypothetical protein